MQKLLSFIGNLFWQWEDYSPTSRADDYRAYGYEEIAQEFEVEGDQDALASEE